MVWGKGGGKAFNLPVETLFEIFCGKGKSERSKRTRGDG